MVSLHNSVKSIPRVYCPFPKQNTHLLSIPRVPFEGNLARIKIPVYKLGKSPPSVDDKCFKEFLLAFDTEQTLLDALLLAQWEDFSEKGLLNYDVTTCNTKVVGGGIKFVAQLNENWNLDLLAESGNITDKEHGHFDCNDLKIFSENILFCVTTGDEDSSDFVLSATVPKNSVMVIINETPLEYGHVFLLPYNLQHPENLVASLKATLHVVAEVNNFSFRVFYDPPTCSNPDNMHFQACYFANQLPVENMQLISIFNGLLDEEINIYEIADYPVKALVFSSNGNFNMLAEIVSEICSLIPQQSAQCNLLISDCGKKIFFFLQLPTVGNYLNLSAWECGGHFVFNASDDFDNATEKSISKRMATVSLGEEAFQAVKQLCCDVAANKHAPMGQVL